MLPLDQPQDESVDSKTYPLGEKSELPRNGHALALVALSHTPVEHRLYSAMLAAPEIDLQQNSFTVRHLMSLTGIRSLSTLRRGLEGLLQKFSIQKHHPENGNGKRDHASVYRVYQPNEVIARRKENGGSELSSYVIGRLKGVNGNHAFERAIERVAENPMLSRREAQVALCCVEGLTNADIGRRLEVSEQTVKFHLRHIFIKFGVKRRAELISRLLS